jgi:uncharacterized membrane protein
VSDPDGAAPADRAWWTLAALMLLGLSIQISLSATTFPVVILVSIVLAVAGLATIVVAWTRTAAVPRALPWLLLGLTLLAVVTSCITQVYAAPAYGTDEIAFDQFAANLALHGHNPYLHSMAPSFSAFHVSPNGYTFHLNGTPVTALSYPALAFLLYLPLMALGVHSQLAVIVNVLAWLAATVLLFLLTPRRLAPLAIVVGGLGFYVSYAVGGVTDALFVPFVIIAAFQWDRFATRPSWRYAYGPIALGLAMSIKQTPWFVLPLILVALWREAAPEHGWLRGVRVPLRYLGWTAAAFLLTNVDYVIHSPVAWWHHITTPLAGDVVPAGQGLVGLSLFLRIGGGDLRLFSALSIVALGVLVLLVAIGPATVKRSLFILPSVVLFFASRSFGNYFIALVPAAVVGAVSVMASSGARDRMPSFQVRAFAIGIPCAAFAALFAAALLTRPPLSVEVLGIRTTGQLATVEQITLAVHNRSDHAVSPAFTIDEGGNFTTFWRVLRGPQELPAGATTSYTLESPSFFAQPSISGGFQVMAFSDHPAAVSHTTAYNPSTLHVALDPAAIDHAVPVGQPVTVTAELLDRLNRPVRRAGVPIFLGQIIYAQDGLEYATVRVDGGRPGATPVVEKTNAEGMATFVLRATDSNSDPVYFEANLVSSTRDYPFGYSTILAIRFGPR